MNISIGMLKVNHIAGPSGVNIGTNLIISPTATIYNQIGTMNNGDGNTLWTYNPIHDPDVVDAPSNTMVGLF